MPLQIPGLNSGGHRIKIISLALVLLRHTGTATAISFTGLRDKHREILPWCQSDPAAWVARSPASYHSGLFCFCTACPDTGAGSAQTCALAAVRTPGTCSSWSIRTGWLIKARTWCTCVIWNRKELVFKSRAARPTLKNAALHISKLHISKWRKKLLRYFISKHCNAERWIIFEKQTQICFTN